jgi:hypothetical protein
LEGTESRHVIAKDGFVELSCVRRQGGLQLAGGLVKTVAEFLQVIVISGQIFRSFLEHTHVKIHDLSGNHQGKELVLRARERVP